MIYAHTVEEHGKAKRPWVARIVGLDPSRTFRRLFVRPRRDWAHAVQRMGGRIDGVRSTFLLEDGWVCEFFAVKDPWKKTEQRFFGKITGGRVVRLTFEQVLDWLSGHR